MSGTTSGGSPAKATFEALEGKKGTFTVQYNPKEFKEDRKVSWKEVDTQGQDKPSLEFQQGSPRSVSMELLFDTTTDQKVPKNGGSVPEPQSVYTQWVEPLMSLTNVNVQPSTGESAKQRKNRPTTVLFTWGNYKLTCVVESLSTSYTLFSASGTPLRAKVQIKLKEWKQGTFAFTNGAAGFEGSSIKLVEAVAGQTPSSVASEHGTTPQQICRDNGRADPLEPFAGGEQLLVRPGYCGDQDQGGGVEDFLEDLGEDLVRQAASSAASAVRSLF
jgi:hypothetical protein